MCRPELPLLSGAAFEGDRIGVVDVFSAIAEGADSDQGGRREAALDYVVWFVDLVNGRSTHSVPVAVFRRGWTDEAESDDFVARWIPALPGDWNALAIDPPFGAGHDEGCEIDAVRAALGMSLSVEAPDGLRREHSAIKLIRFDGAHRLFE